MERQNLQKKISEENKNTFVQITKSVDCNISYLKSNV